MLAFISPLDGDYISLKRAALLMARENPGIDAVDLMDMFKHAIFSREFDGQGLRIPGLDPDDDRNYPLLLIEAPPAKIGFARRLPRPAKPHEYLSVTAHTVAQVLGERDMLPGPTEEWVEFIEGPPCENVTDITLEALANIPYVAFPAEAQTLLGNILLAKAKLITWMEHKGYALPAFLVEPVSASEEGDVPVTPSEILNKVRSKPKAPTNPSPPKPAPTVESASCGDDVRGRPQKAAWQRIRELVRELHAADPTRQRSLLAFDAHERAKLEFDEKDLPSVKTIIRRMKNILGTEG